MDSPTASIVAMYSAAIAGIILGIDFVVGLLGLLIVPQFDLLTFVAGVSLFEFGVLMIIGGCLAAREPLDDAKRYDSGGKPVRSHTMAMTGKRLLLVGLFLFLYGLAISMVLWMWS